MSVYKYGKWLKIIIVILIVALIIVFGMLIFTSSLDDKISDIAFYVITLISILFIGLCLLGIRDLFVSKVVISSNYISSKNALFDRKLRVEEIKGYKKIEHYILIFPKGKLKKRIKISDFIYDRGEIQDWLQSNFVDLNLLEGEKEEKEFYRNPEFGMSIQEKEKLLKKAQLTAKWVKNLSIAITVLAFILVKFLNKEIFVYFLVFIPLIIILIVIFFKGIVKYDEKKEDEKTVYPSVLWGFLAPIFGLFLYVMFSINILKYDAIWNILIYSTLIIFFLCIYGSKEYKLQNARVIGSMISLLIFSAMYCFSVIILFNVFFDNSDAKLYKASILEKRVNKGKSTSYYFKLNNKNLSKNAEEFNVPKLIFNSKNIGDTVNIFVNEGKLKIPYYKIK
jgi:hypothetical protein